MIKQTCVCVEERFVDVCCSYRISDAVAADEPGRAHGGERARLSGAMIDDGPDGKGSNHPARGPKRLLFSFSLCGFTNR